MRIMGTIILDLDTGIDDALALAVALANAERVNIAGISTTFGNVSTRTSVRNTCALLHHFSRHGIPVVMGKEGCGNNIYVASQFQYRIHGENGIGNVILQSLNDSESKDDIVSFYNKILAEHNGNVTLITTGPLTNLAFYMKESKSRLFFKKIISMAGCIMTKGNITPYAEANIYKDAEAASHVFSHTDKLTLLPLDVTQTLFLEKTECMKWNDEIYRQMTDYYIAFHGGEHCFIHDPSTIAYLLHPEYFMTEKIKISVTTDGEEKGHMNISHDGSYINAALSCDREAVVKFLTDSWMRIFS